MKYSEKKTCTLIVIGSRYTNCHAKITFYINNRMSKYLYTKNATSNSTL